MSGAELRALAPLLVLAGGTVLLMLLAALKRSHALAAGACMLVLAAALAVLPLAAGEAPLRATALLTIDRFGLTLIGVLCAAALGAALLASSYLARRQGPSEELYVLLLAATLGACALVVSSHLASLFLALEVLSVSLFAMAGYATGRRTSLEAALKYLVLSGSASALLLYGMALTYFRSGALDFGALATHSLAQPGDALLAAGYVLTFAGLAFKLSLVPFHFWTPDVYQGAPAPVTAFLSTVSKAAVAALLLRYMVETRAFAQAGMALAFEVVAVASIVVGNLLALLQRDVKRILAYSSIAHLGYLLIAFIAAGPFGTEAVGYYLIAYVVMTLAAFGVVSHLSAGAAREVTALEDYRGLAWHRPWPAALLAAAMLSLAGMPVTAGFVAKFYVFTAGVAAQLWSLVAALVAGSVLGLFYYLRVIAALVSRPEEAFQAAPAPRAVPATAALVGLGVLLVLLGAYPQPLIDAVYAAAATLH